MIPFTQKIKALTVVENKTYSKEVLNNTVRMWRFFEKKVVFTNGCFDILHRGHIDYLAKASDLGNELIIAVNSDASVKRLEKGNSRPLQDEQTRAMVLASLHFVSAVIIFDEETPFELINFLKPDVLVKGADYDSSETNPLSKKYIVGSDVVKANGGEVKTIEFLEGFSTTLIEEKIKNFNK
ncbi:MAG: D-beta-D-heptose 1-phosphate adenosyltransferase [Bacteroidetes bacterium RIFCSPLOWO2_12_FULL_35_15]|nr:MAG: D-beta-D-heptose 1-phosphate adenosyltransferase [Bacteroidetes bacterium RIFCSPLOWO2_12_FULL_35_15]